MSSLPTPPYTSDEHCKHPKLEPAHSPPRYGPRASGITLLCEDSPWHRDEARLVLQDLKNFIAFGCLSSQYELTSSEDAEEDGPLAEIFSTPLAPDLDQYRRDLDHLIAAGWIRVFARPANTAAYGTVLHVYALAADVGHSCINRSDRQARVRLEMLRSIVTKLDVSSDLWSGKDVKADRVAFDMWATPDHSSLYWTFNNIPSPAPSTDGITSSYRKQAISDIISSNKSIRGLESQLYPFQQRSTALMLQRESETRVQLDPRLEQRTAPDGSLYCYSPRDFHFLRRPRQYECVKGGLLAETMGNGKTVIAIALVLSTRGLMPQIPVEYARSRTSTTVPSLVDLCVRCAVRNSVPWRNYFDQREELTGESMTSCTHRLQSHFSSYEVPRAPLRSKRVSALPPAEVKILTATTVIVVPRNLCSQWQAEIKKHTKPDALKVLVMDDIAKELPNPDELRTFDIILFSLRRFEKEDRDGSDEYGRRFSTTPLSCACPYIKATRKRDCTCLRPEDVYTSPLRRLHFLRIIIDEGHSFASALSTAPRVAEKLVAADHRWVVSGTPAKNLLGVEMDLYSSESSPMTLHDEAGRADILVQRKAFDPVTDTQGAIKSLGSLLSNFLRVKPWSGGQGEDSANWDEYIYRHENAKRRTFAAFSTALHRTLGALVVKIELPSLTHTIVKLNPSFYDKITMNLFTFVLSANAITSERKDQDYLFHKDSAKHRYQLIAHLRQSAFFWTAFTVQDVQSTIDTCTRYLDKEDTECSLRDRALLKRCISFAENALNTRGWTGMSSIHELGLFIKDWPEESSEHWTLDGTDPILTGATQVHDAQDFIHRQLAAQESIPELGLGGQGIKALSRARKAGLAETSAAEKGTKNALVAAGVPKSSVNGESFRLTNTGRKRNRDNPMATKPDTRAGEKRRGSTESTESASTHIDEEEIANAPALESTSPLLRARLIGTVSAKASYLLSQVIQNSATSKILIFYSGDNIAYYIAQCLEVLHVEHLIYARTLTPAQKSSYVVDFQSQDKIRVMLMDVHQAAFGLNLTAADRVYFVNPVCNPAVEAQAIKRAHRIGQQKEVKVETLVLEGGLELDMFERARRMSHADHHAARHLEDDGGVRAVIEQARLVDLSPEELLGGTNRMARLDQEQQVWTRPGWWEWADGKWQGRREQKKKGRKRIKIGGEGDGNRTSLVKQE